jgi:hypothetical protein
LKIKKIWVTATLSGAVIAYWARNGVRGEERAVGTSGAGFALSISSCKMEIKVVARDTALVSIRFSLIRTI